MLIADTCQYISIIDSLTFLFEKLFVDSTKSDDKPKVMINCVTTVMAHILQITNCTADILKLNKFKNYIETTNPLGPKTKVHTLGAVYF